MPATCTDEELAQFRFELTRRKATIGAPSLILVRPCFFGTSVDLDPSAYPPELDTGRALLSANLFGFWQGIPVLEANFVPAWDFML